MREEIIGDARLILGDCRDILANWVLDKIDVVITDPPYGMLDEEWDVIVDPKWWMVAPSVCFAAEPYATKLINTATLSFKYDLVWAKNQPTNPMNAKLRPMRGHERILIFGPVPYFPQKRKRAAVEMSRLNVKQRELYEYFHPDSVLYFEVVNNRNSERTAHPSQKPTELLEWLVSSYSASDHLVLDPFMGSGTTGVACTKYGRKFIGFEQDPDYFEIACDRIRKIYEQPRLRTVGIEEGSLCRRDGCCGRLAIKPTENCSCHINPPCSSCVEAPIYCPDCEWEAPPHPKPIQGELIP